MRNIFIIAVLAFGMNVTAQTTVGTTGQNYTIIGAKTNINTSNVDINTAGGTVKVIGNSINLQGGNTNIAGNNTTVNTTYTSLNSTQTFVNGEKTEFRQGGLIKTLTTISQAGISTAGSVTGAQIYTQGMEVGNEIINLKNGVNSKASQTSVTNLTNRVTTTETKINDLYNVKADKVQVAQDIQQARREAIRISNEYTDEKIMEVNYKVDKEVTRLDGRIDATNTTVEANKKEAAAATEKVQSNLDKESKRLDMRIDTETQRVESKLNQRITEVDLRLTNRIDAVMTYVGNEFKAVNNRIEGLGASMVALSAAATSSVYNANKPTNLNIGTGFYGRSTAIAVGMSHFFNASTKVSFNWSQGSHTKNAVGIGAGFAF